MARHGGITTSIGGLRTIAHDPTCDVRAWRRRASSRRSSTSLRHDAGAARDGDSSLRHVLVVGGTLAEWDALSDDEWADGSTSLGAGARRARRAVAHAAGLRARRRRPPTLDLRALASRPSAAATVIVDPRGDGRAAVRRGDAAARSRRRGQRGDGRRGAVRAGRLSSPTSCVVLGPPTQLPPSLVWELAYSELVFVPVAWGELRAEHLAGAIADFSSRRRRFGGLDDE